MPMNNLADLTARMGRLMNRTDLAADAAEAVILYEAEANRYFRTPEMLTTTTVAGPIGRIVPLPTDFLQLKRLTWVGGGGRRNLEPIGTEASTRYSDGVTTGSPERFDIIDEGIELMPAPGGSAGTIEVVYYQRIPTLSLGSNWLLLRHPDVYLYGTLKHLAILRGDKERLQKYKGLHDEAAVAVQQTSNRAQYGSALQIRVA